MGCKGVIITWTCFRDVYKIHSHGDNSNVSDLHKLRNFMVIRKTYEAGPKKTLQVSEQVRLKPGCIASDG